MIYGLLLGGSKKNIESKETIPPKINQNPPILTQRKDANVAGKVDKGPNKIKIQINKDSLFRKTNKAFKAIPKCQIPISTLKIIKTNLKNPLEFISAYLELQKIVIII